MQKGAVRSWVLSFTLPFLLVGVCFGFVFGKHQYKDITEIHPGQFMNYTEADTVRSSWESGIQFGLLFGIPAGLLGTGVYGSFLLIQKWRSKKNQ